MISQFLGAVLLFSSSFIYPLSTQLPEYLYELEDKKYWTMLEAPKQVDLPDIFTDFEDIIGSFDTQACKNNVLYYVVQNKNDHHIYTVFATNADECDGGNSYGLIFKTKTVTKKTIRAYVQDYAIVDF